MAVHVDSVIDTWLSTFNNAFYVSLTDKEEYLYNAADVEGENAKTSAVALMTQLMDGINAWKAESTPARSAASLNGIASFLYTYNMYVERFGMATVANSVLDAKNVFNMAGFFDAVIARPVSYYDDLVEDTENPPDYTSAKLLADIEATDGGNWEAEEESALNAVETASVGAVRALNGASLFDGLPPAPVGVTPKTKQEIAEWIFLELNWKWVVDTFPAASMNIPNIITSPPP